MTYTDSDRYIDALEDIVNTYNSRVHRSIGIAPNDVNLDNQEEIWWRLYPPIIDKQRPSLKRGQFVRISKNKLAFEKGYGGLLSGEIYRVTEVKETLPPVYEIEDLNGEKITGTFYENELQRVEKPKTYKIEKILGTKRSGNKNSFLSNGEVFRQHLTPGFRKKIWFNAFILLYTNMYSFSRFFFLYLRIYLCGVT